MALRQPPYLLPSKTPARPAPRTTTPRAVVPPSRPAPRRAPVARQSPLRNAPGPGRSRWMGFAAPVPVMRGMTPQGAQAITVRRQAQQTVDKVQRAVFPEDYRPDESLAGKIFGGISAPFRLAGGFIKNAASEVIPMPEGLARVGYEYGRNVGQVLLSPLPGIEAKPALDRMADMTYGTVKGLKDDVVFVGDPLIHGNVRELAKRIYQQPVRTLGTIGGVYSAAGSTAGALLRVGGRATGSAALARAGSKAFTAREGVPVPRRYRAPELLQPAKDKYGRAVLPVPRPIERPMRPRSANPITREIQKNITDPAIAAIKRGVGSIEPTNPMLRRLTPMSNSARYNRAARAGFRNRASQFLEHEDAFIQNETFDLAKLVRRSSRRMSGVPGAARRRSARADQAYYTATIRAMGLNHLSPTKTSRTWGRDALIAKYEKQAARHAQGNPEFAKMAERNLAALKSIPDEWLDPATAPKHINNLTKQTEKVLRESTDIKVEGGVITPSTAERSGYRMQEVAAGVDDVGMTMRDSIVRQREAAKTAVVAKGKVAGFDKQIAEVKTKIAANPQRAAGLKAQLKSLESQRSGAKRSMNEAVKNERLHSKVADESRAVIDSELGGMKPGAYFPNYRQLQRGLRSRVGNRPVLGASPRMTLPRERKNMNVVANEGTMAFTPDVTMAAIRDAADMRGRAKALSRAVDDFVVRSDDGVPVTADDAINLAEQSNGLYVAKTKKELMRILDADARWTESKFSDTARGRHSVPEGEQDALMSQLDELADGDTHYLIPKAAEQGWKDALGKRQNIIDDLNQYFKAGVLALSPRWYVQNGVGMSLQFMLGSGLDLKAVVTAGLNPRRIWSKAVRERNRLNRERVAPEIEGTGLTSDLGAVARRSSGRGSINPLKRIIQFGYQANSRLEAIPRRAMFWHMAKKKLKDEGLLEGFMTNEAKLMEAWDDVARSAARGDKAAEALIDDIVRETDRFMGNYSRYNSFERTILRRVFPFYGWMRAIHRLAFTLPFKYPKRSMVLNVASRMAAEMYNDDESSLMPNYRGIIIGDNNDRFLQTSIANPYSSINETANLAYNVGDLLQREGASGLTKIPAEAIQAFYPQISPIFTDIPEAALGVSALNIPTPFSPNADNTLRDPRTGRRFTVDSRGNISDAVPRGSFETMLGSNVPLYNLVRKFLAGGNPTADASVGELANFAIRGRPAKDKWKYVVPKPLVGSTLERDRLRTDILGAIIGTPIWDYNSMNALMDQLRRWDTYQNASDDYINKRLTSQYMP